MSGHEEKTTLQNTTVVIDKAKNCFSFYLLRQTKYIQPHKDEIQLLLFLYCWKSFMYFCKRNRDAEERKKLLLKDLVQYHVGSVSSAIIHQCTRNTSGRRQIQEVRSI